MTIFDRLEQDGYEHFEDFNDNGIILSSAYAKGDSLIVIDHEAIIDHPFSYMRYCQKQNEWMCSWKKVFRFLNDDIDMYDRVLDNRVLNADMRNGSGRELHAIDPSPLEYLFETAFVNVYGNQGLLYLRREAALMALNGRYIYVDYLLRHHEGHFIAVEENGLKYHHPYLIKKKCYRRILLKQNSIVHQGGILFRWDTESMKNLEKISDEIYEFIGDMKNYRKQIYYQDRREFKLYDHQETYRSRLREDRVKGVRSALVVLPTATGKTEIAMNDMAQFYEESPVNETLIMVPQIEMVKQWEAALKERINHHHLDHIHVKTYMNVARHYPYDESSKYDYIVFDEAHHAVSPVMRKVLKYYNPSFLLGMTATDQRLDKQKLEEVFGEYETEMTLQEAIEKKILCPIRCYRLETNIDLSKVRFNGKDYYNRELERTIRVPSRNRIIADVLKRYFHDQLKGKSGLVFCVNVEHAKEMAGLLRDRGIKAQSVDGKDPKRKEKINQYMNGEIQFLCTCSLLTEGWDAPRTSVIVMARPTLSKVLYVQQLGRGTRRYPDKEALYVIDVVDNYGGLGAISNRPWSLHALFDLDLYKPFGDLFGTSSSEKEMEILDTVNEEVIRLDPVDIFTFEKLYANFISEEQLARELFVSTGTVKNWVRKKEVTPDIRLPFGRGHVLLFDPQKIEGIREEKGLKHHTDETIVKDFWQFIEKGDYTFSYKMYFILAVLDTVNDSGEADAHQLLKKYQQYYLSRYDNGEVIDRPNSPYNELAYVKDTKIMMQSMLSNPFEKFERKRFLYHSKDLGKIAFHHRLWDEMSDIGKRVNLKEKILSHLENYYSTL